MISPVQRSKKSNEKLYKEGGKIIYTRFGKTHLKKLNYIMSKLELNTTEALRHLIDSYKI